MKACCHVVRSLRSAPTTSSALFKRHTQPIYLVQCVKSNEKTFELEHNGKFLEDQFWHRMQHAVIPAHSERQFVYIGPLRWPLKAHTPKSKCSQTHHKVKKVEDDFMAWVSSISMMPLSLYAANKMQCPCSCLQTVPLNPRYYRHPQWTVFLSFWKRVAHCLPILTRT